MGLFLLFWGYDPCYPLFLSFLPSHKPRVPHGCIEANELHNDLRSYPGSNSYKKNSKRHMKAYKIASVPGDDIGKDARIHERENCSSHG